MEVKQVDPYKINIDETNERKHNIDLSDLEESVAEVGVVQPPLVRVRDEDAEVPYSVVIGQRRVLAAQGVDLDEIPVVVVEGWNDKEALKASLTENIDLFRQAVAGKDRAKALERLWFEMGGEGFPSSTELAEELGVPEPTIRGWVEYLRPEYKGTPLHAHHVKESDDRRVDEMSVDVDSLATDAVREIRAATGGGEKAVELAKEVESGNLTTDDVREIRKRKKAGQDIDEAVESVKQVNRGPAAKSFNVKFSGVERVKLEECAMDRGIVEADVIRTAVNEHLNANGYYDDVPSEKRKKAMKEHQ